MQEMQVRSLDQEAPLEKEMVTHYSILVWEIPRKEEPGGCKELDTTEQLNNKIIKEEKEEASIWPGTQWSLRKIFSSSLLPFIRRPLSFSLGVDVMQLTDKPVNEEEWVGRASQPWGVAGGCAVE